MKLRRRLAAWRLAIVAAACLVLAGCVTLDAEQDSICRRTLPVLLGAEQGVRVLASFTDGDRTIGVRAVTLGDGIEHMLLCTFAASGLDPRKRQIVGLHIDSFPVSPSALYFIRTRWLETQAALAAEPAAARNDPLLGHVPFAEAYVLQQALSALPKMGIYALLAAAYALIYGLIGRIYLGFGALVALGGIVAIIAIVVTSGLVASTPVALAAGAIVAIFMSGLYGVFIAKWVVVPLSARSGQQSLIASIGILIALEEFLRLAQGANTRWLAPVYSAPLVIARAATFDATMTPMNLAVAGLAITIALALLVHLKWSRFGREWRASADEPVAAELFGVSRSAVLVRAFAIASALAGLTGVMIVAHYGGIGFAGGSMLGLTALVAAILGGIGSVGAAMAGGLIIGAVEAAWSAVFPIANKDALIFVLLAVLLALKPDGLFGQRLP